MNRFARSALAAAVLSALPVAAEATVVEYYIGRDANNQPVTAGAYAGLDRPNYNHLTFLLAHGDHYHGKGAKVYTGTPPNHAVVDPSAGNSLPEAGGSTIPLQPGSGVFAGKLISGLTPGVDQTELRIRSVDSLASGAGPTLPVPAFAEPAAVPPSDPNYATVQQQRQAWSDYRFSASPEHVLFHSSPTVQRTPANPTGSGRWAESLAGSNLTLHLLSISNGLTIADAGGNVLMDNTGDTVALGDGGLVDFTPIFVANTTAEPQTLSATFRITDAGAANAGGPWAESGAFTFNVSVPEPASAALLAPLGLLVLRRRR